MKFLSLLSLLLLSPWVFAQNISPPVNTDYLWRQAVTGAVIGRPAVHEQSVAVVLDGGMVKAFSARGRPLWSFSIRGRLCPYITMSREGISYFCGTNGTLIAVNRTGRELWRASVGGALSAPVVLGWDGRVFVPAGKRISCYTVSGNRLWKLDLAAAISAGPVLDNSGCVILVLQNGDAMCINPFGESRVWPLPKGSPRIVVPIGGKKPLILALYDNGSVEWIETGSSIAEPVNVGTLADKPLAAAVKGNNVAAILANGQLVLISGRNGQIRWTADTHVRVLRERGEPAAETEAAVVYDERGIFMLSASGVTRVNSAGRRLWFTTLKNASGIPAFGEDGVLYSGGTDWILYAWKPETDTAHSASKPYRSGPEGFYGLGEPPFSGPAAPPDQLDEIYLRKKLNSMRGDILAGRVGEHEPEWIAWLMEIAQGGGQPAGFGGAQSSVPIMLRIQALQLLSMIGSNEAIPWLTLFFRREKEPSVRAAAARAIGGIGTDPGGRAMQEFLRAVTVGNPAREEQVFTAVAAATGSLCRFSGPPLFQTGAQVLSLLLDSGQSAVVQRQARREMESLQE